MSKILFLDNIQRTIVADLVKEDDNFIYVKTPTVFSALPTQEGKLQVQLYPVFFKEFLKNRKTETPVWKYNKNTITLTEAPVDLEGKLQEQFDNLFAPVVEGEAPVVPLFDEKNK